MLKILLISNLQTNIEANFATKKEFTTQDIFTFYKEQEIKIPKSTVNWRVYELVKKGIIKRVGKGRFIWGTESKFQPPISDRLKEISTRIKTQFPYINYCIWDNEMLKSLHQHFPMLRFILIDAEKDVMESLFDFLRESNKNIYIKPDKIFFDKYITDNSSIIIRQLITESPLQETDKVPTVTLEKLLVDIFSDNEFEYLQGSELQVIYKNAFEHFTVNKSKLLRYAGRKGQFEKVWKFLTDNNFVESI